MVLSSRNRSNEHKQTQKFSSKYQEKLFSCEDDRTLAQVTLRGCRIPLLGDSQKLSGHSPGQSPVGVCVLEHRI